MPKKAGITLILFLLTFVASALFASGLSYAQEIPTGKYLGSYYNGINFDALVFTRYDDVVNFNWRTKSPGSGVNSDNFSIRWQGKFYFDTYLYQFTAISDDGVRVYLDGENIIDAWQVQSYVPHKVQKQISAGEHTVVVEYFESGVYAAVNVFWEKVTPTVATQPEITPGVGGGGGGVSPTIAPGLLGVYASECTILEAVPTEGNAPLAVSFTGAGYDPYGAIALYKFNFADNSSDATTEGNDYFADHTYKTPGNYTATLTIKDSKGNYKTSDKCKLVISVTGTAVDEGGTPTLEPEEATISALPKTGIFDQSIILVILIAATGFFGAYLNKNFKLS
jgi:hypothetical protein